MSSKVPVKKREYGKEIAVNTIRVTNDKNHNCKVELQVMSLSIHVTGR